MRQTDKDPVGFRPCAFIVLAAYLMIGSITGFCQSADQPAAPPPLPPAAQDALNKGIIAAKVPDYLLAIRYFEDARKIAPDSPIIFFNLGLAESKIPGRELRAIAWFGAYLAANPTAPKAAAVKEQITVLDVRNHSNTSRLIKSAEDAEVFNQHVQVCRTLIRIADAKIKAGDLAGAKNSLASALKSARLIDTQPWDGFMTREREKSMELKYIAEAQAKAGDIAGALKTADLNRFAGRKSWAQSDIAEAQARSGDIAGAQKTFVKALNTADLIQDTDDNKSVAQSDIAEAQARSGDIAGAQKTFVKALNTAYLTQDAEQKSLAQKAIAKAQLAGQRQTSTPLIQPVITVSDWLKKLGDDNKSNDCPLNTDPFLNLAGYLKSLPSDDPWEIFDGMLDAAEKIVGAQNVIDQMVKQQAKK